MNGHSEMTFNHKAWDLTKIQKELSITSGIIERTFVDREKILYAGVKKFIAETVDLSETYPEFRGWLENSVYPGLLNGTRTIVLQYRGNQISGFSIIKNDQQEKKICCLYVLPKFQRAGVGLDLFQRSFDLLDSETPLITISEKKEQEFKRLVRYFGFSDDGLYDGIYKQGVYEKSYNGLLLPSVTAQIKR